MGLFRKNPSVEDMRRICDVIYDAMSFAEPEVVSFPEVGLVIRIRVLPGIRAVLAYNDRQWFAKEFYVDEATGDLLNYQPPIDPLPVTSRDASPVVAAKEIGGYLMERLRLVINDEAAGDHDREYAAHAFQQLAERMEGGPSRY